MYRIYFARCMNIFNSLLAQLVKYDVHTTRKINSIHAICYHILSFYLCKTIRWGYNGNLKMLSELLHHADMKLFRSILHSTHCIHQLLPYWNLCQWNSALLTVLLLSPTATITSTNIHSFYDVFLMKHINCYCVVAWPAIHCYSFFMYFFFLF